MLGNLLPKLFLILFAVEIATYIFNVKFFVESTTTFLTDDASQDEVLLNSGRIYSQIQNILYAVLLKSCVYMISKVHVLLFFPFFVG